MNTPTVPLIPGPHDGSSVLAVHPACLPLHQKNTIAEYRCLAFIENHEGEEWNGQHLPTAHIVAWFHKGCTHSMVLAIIDRFKRPEFLL